MGEPAMRHVNSFGLTMMGGGILVGVAAALTFAAVTAPAASATASSSSMLTDFMSRMQIERLINDYYSCLTPDCRARHPGEGSFYTPDGVNNVNGYIAKGPEAINAQYKYVATQEVLPRGKFDMMITNLVIAVHADAATVQDMWTGVSSLTPESTPQFVEMGHEYVSLVKVDGRWYYKTRHVVSDAGLPQMFVKTYSSQ